MRFHNLKEASIYSSDIVFRESRQTKALKILAGTMGLSIQPAQSIVNDLATDPGDRATRERKILDLAENGDTIAAAYSTLRPRRLGGTTSRFVL